jgi:hypothetical protein
MWFWQCDCMRPNVFSYLGEQYHMTDDYPDKSLSE